MFEDIFKNSMCDGCKDIVTINNGDECIYLIYDKCSKVKDRKYVSPKVSVKEVDTSKTPRQRAIDKLIKHAESLDW